MANIDNSVFNNLDSSVRNNAIFRSFVNRLQPDKINDGSLIEFIYNLDSSVLTSENFIEGLTTLHRKDDDIITNGKFSSAIEALSESFLTSREFIEFVDRLDPNLLERRDNSFSFSGQLRAEYIDVLQQSFSLDTLRDESLNQFINKLNLDSFRDGSFVDFITTTESFVLTDADFTEALASRDESVLTNGRFTEEVQQLSIATRTTDDFSELLSGFSDSRLSIRGDNYTSILPPSKNDGRGGGNEEGGSAFEDRRNENYDHVMKSQDFAIRIYDAGIADGDRVSVFLNGGDPIVSNIELTEAGTLVPISIGANANRLSIVAANAGSAETTTVGVEFVSLDGSGSSVFIGDTMFGGEITSGQSLSRAIGLPKIVIDGTRTPYSAQHILDVPDPQILTVRRTGSDARRKLNVDNYVERNGLVPEFFQIDEVPFASTEEGSSGRADTRPIPGRDNESGGSQFGRQINNYGGLKLEDGQSIDLRATEPDYESDNNIITPGLPDFSPTYGLIGTDRQGNPIGDVLDGVPGEDNLIYGTAGGDILRGAESASGDNVDYLLGDLGRDTLIGKSGDDFLLGQGGDDLIYGDSGDDLIYGGPGIDTLYGDSGDGEPDVQGNDIFVIRRGEDADLIADFQLGGDRIALVDGLKFADLMFDPIRGSNLLSFEEAVQEAQSLRLGGGEPVEYPEFRGSIEVVTFGARIKDSRNGNVLAFVNGPIGEAINDPDNFIEQPGGSGRRTLAGIV